MKIRDDEKLEPAELCALRIAVGWAANASDYPAAFERYAWTESARDESGKLVGFCAVLSDGVRHAFLIDVSVHPESQRRGLGCKLVTRAVERAREQGIAVVHVDFNPQSEAFYRACGFRVGLAGILETRSAP